MTIEESFNPPGGFGAFGTWQVLFADVAQHLVSIRRADLGLLEQYARYGGRRSPWRFQSAGRIWGFWNRRCLRSGLGIRRVSIRRADLGLLEQ